MHIIPVIDLKGGVVVRGMAGRRSEYRPVRSPLAPDARPDSVAQAFSRGYGFTRVYVADLDAISGGEPDWQAWKQIAASGLRLIIDAGVGQPDRAEAVRDFFAGGQGLDAIVVGLESVAEAGELAVLGDLLGPQLAAFSLDLHEGRPFSQRPAWHTQTPPQIADTAVSSGFRRLIVLDLARVGCNAGPSVAPLCRALRDAHPGIELIAGGGVRGVEDLQLLAAAGCDAVLVASALHDGCIPLKSEIRISKSEGNPKLE